MAKTRLYDGDQSAAWTIHRIVRDFMAAFSPVCPFFSHHITSTLYESSAVDVREFPETPIVCDSDLCALSNSIQEFNSTTWKQKKDAGLSLNAPIEGILIPADLVDFTEVLTAMHKLE
jgi:valyl-tRNA synthetase